MNTSYSTLNFDLGEEINMLRDRVYQFLSERNCATRNRDR